MGMARQKDKKEADSWQFLVEAAKRGVEAQGFELERVPGRGLSNVWNLKRDGAVQPASIRTTRDRWFAFPPLANGNRWKTLDEVDLVVVAAVDSKDSPKNIEVYIFPAEEVRKRFKSAHKARSEAGLAVRDDFGMWVGLDADVRGIPASVGSGIVDQHPPVAVYPIETLLSGNEKPTGIGAMPASAARQSITPDTTTIADVLSRARQQIADIAAVRVEAVRLDLKIEY